MTRRIALAILLSACGMLVAGGIAAYVAMHQALLADLDDRLVERARTVLYRTRGSEDSTEVPAPRGDRYVIRDATGQQTERLPPNIDPGAAPITESSGFVRDAAGNWMRVVSLQWFGKTETEYITVVYASPAARFERTRDRLAMTLMVVLGIGVTATGAIAGRVSRIATRPLQQTAEAIGNIDERRLSRRIDPSAVPRELIPVVTRLNEMLERLERAFAQRRQFMIGAAHELRTPVAALQTTIEVALQRPKDAAALTLVLEKCLVSIRMLTRLADLLTEQLRDETPVHSEELEFLDVSALLAECAEIVEPLARAKQITLVRSFPAALPVVTYPDRLRSIVTNLLSNAVEYTPIGGRVELECIFNKPELFLAVHDTGIGIAVEHLPNVWQPFYRVDGARRRDRDHLGLGLYLVKSHVEALGGSCYLSSEPTQGTTVTLRFPVRPPPEDASYEPEISENDPSASE